MSRRMRWIVKGIVAPLVLALVTPAIAAPADPPTTVAVVAAPPIAVTPEGGVDPDVAKRLEDVAHVVAGAPSAADLEHALAEVLVVYQSPDPFSLGQRERVRGGSISLLGAIAERAHRAGQLGVEARALDARWTLAGKPRDPQLAEVLTRWAEHAPPAQALYLVRRARAADPRLRAAASLDEDLSRNHHAWTGRLAILAGFVALGVGYYAQKHATEIENDLAMHARPGADVDSALRSRDIYDLLGTSLLIAAPVLSVGGCVWMLTGVPKHAPVSPAELPALEAP